jgi:hypothetical protein
MKIPIFYRQILFIFFFISALGYLIWTYIGQDTLIHHTFWYSNLFVLFVTALSHLIAYEGLAHIKDFHVFYFISMGMRFILCIIYIFCFVFLGVDNTLSFVFNFLCLYLVYTSFEIYTLIRNLRSDYK